MHFLEYIFLNIFSSFKNTARHVLSCKSIKKIDASFFAYFYIYSIFLKFTNWSLVRNPPTPQRGGYKSAIRWPPFAIQVATKWTPYCRQASTIWWPYFGRLAVERAFNLLP
jgi:hypothetical protein